MPKIRAREGVTLIELIIVIVIIGVLSVIAIARYSGVNEAAMGAKGRHALGLIAQAEKMHQGEFLVFIAVADGGFGASALDNQLQMAEIDADGDWDYDVTIAGGGATFTATATRTAGNSINTIITLDDTGVWAGTFPF